MTERELDKWDKIARERETAKTRKIILTLANLGLISTWGFAIYYSWFLYTHDGMAAIVAPDHAISWTIFSFGMIGNLILFSVLVTFGYVFLKAYVRIQDNKSRVKMQHV